MRKTFPPISIGDKFGLWTVIADAGKNKQNHKFWLCRCQCGTERPILNIHLKKGNSLSCGGPDCPGRQAKGVQISNTKRELNTTKHSLIVLSLADGQPHQEAEFPSGKLFLLRVSSIPWLCIQLTTDGYIFTVDHELKDICDGRIPRRSLGGKGLAQAIGDLQGELLRLRKQYEGNRNARQWNPDNLLKRELVDLLDWVESALAKINQGAEALSNQPPGANGDTIPHV